MELELKICGKFLNSSKDEQRQLIYDIYKELAKKLEDTIKREFEASIQLNAIVNNNTDSESIKAILRSVHVTLSNEWPPNFNMKFNDELGHLYGVVELPDDLLEVINIMYDKAIDKWYTENEIEDLPLIILGS